MTINKRLREARRRDQQVEKAERKRARREQASAEKAQGSSGEDPDIAGIVPGPQPSSEDGSQP